MTSQERLAVLQLVGQMLIDNSGNRITRSLAIGICQDLDNQLPKADDPPKEPAP